jgi:uncharacterized protein YabE (DUF348 family)
MNKKYFVIPIAIVIILSSVMAQHYLKKEIKVIDNKDQVIRFRTFHQTFEALADDYDFNLSPYDEVSIAPDQPLKDGMTIHIFRDFEVSITIGNETKTVTTNDIQVQDLLAREGIAYDANDKIYPELTQVITNETTIEVTKVDVETETVQKEIPFYTVINFSDALAPGVVGDIHPGDNGLKEVTYEITYENGVEKSRAIVSEEVIEPATNEVVEKGKDRLYVTSRGQAFRYDRAYIMESTAYDLSYQSTGKMPGDRYYGITRSGTRARPGVVAVDPSVIPLGSKLYIESRDYTHDYGFALAEDTGSAIQGNRIDLFINDHTKAMRYGRRTVKVYVLEEQVPEDEIKGYSQRWIYGNN